MSTENIDIRRKRLKYRANYRGFKEADMILGGFAKAHIDGLTLEELNMFEALLAAKDHDIYDWITGSQALPAEHDTPLFNRIQAYKVTI